MDQFDRYQKAVKYLEGLSNIAENNYMEGNRKDPSIYLKRTQWFLNLLGNPCLPAGRPSAVPKFIHITGTAGKGTVAATVQKCLVDSGQRTGLFMSPFVTTSIEKIQVGDLYIAPDEFADIVEKMKPAIDRALLECPWGPPSYFEKFLAVALTYFQQQKCEWVILEVGCGGRYDATNVIPPPIISAITNIDYDHTHVLGKTLSKITRDKAGIIKKGSRFFTTESRPHLRKIMEGICRDQGVKLNYVEGSNKELIKAMGFTPKNVKLPARFEILQTKPMVIIDGAHNRAKIKYTVKNLQRLTYNKLHLVVALAENKNRDILKVIPADYTYPTRFQNPERKCANLGGYSDPNQALDAALARANPDDAILITGSFYLAGELRQRWYSENHILIHRSAF